MNPQNDHNDPSTPPPVSARATPGGEGPENQRGTLRLSENSRKLWTEAMLAALARGNEGRKWHTLIDKIWSPRNLRLALETVVVRKGAAGIDGQTTEAVRKQAEVILPEIERLLKEGRYEPRAVRRVWINKLGSKEKRPLGIPTVRDRLVQTAMLAILEPIFEQDFAESSYGFRVGRNAHQAIAQVKQWMQEGELWVVDADLKGYFDSIPQDRLLERVQEKVADSKVIALLEKFLKQGVMESLKGWEPTEKGTPQGAVISPLLANIYLDELDQTMKQRGRKMVRYADDFIIMCRSHKEAQEVLEEVRSWVEKVGLTLHPQKTRLVNVQAGESFEFLGWHFERGYQWPRKKSQQKLKESIRQRTRRGSGQELRKVIGAVNRVIRGWGQYFRGGVRNVPERLDGWIRMRLRSILRRRAGRKGKGRGLDHHRYPNAYFTERGLISLVEITHSLAASPAK